MNKFSAVHACIPYTTTCMSLSLVWIRCICADNRAHIELTMMLGTESPFKIKIKLRKHKEIRTHMEVTACSEKLVSK